MITLQQIVAGFGISVFAVLAIGTTWVMLRRGA